MDDAFLPLKLSFFYRCYHFCMILCYMSCFDDTIFVIILCDHFWVLQFWFKFIFIVFCYYSPLFCWKLMNSYFKRRKTNGVRQVAAKLYKTQYWHPRNPRWQWHNYWRGRYVHIVYSRKSADFLPPKCDTRTCERNLRSGVTVWQVYDIFWASESAEVTELELSDCLCPTTGAQFPSI